MARHLSASPARSSASPQGRASSSADFAGWEAHIYPGLQLASVPVEARQGLASALGAVGVEAEHMLRLLQAFPPERPSPEAGEALLEQVEAFAARLIPLAAELEVATQAYVTAIADDASVQRDPAPSDPPPAPAEPWWPPFPGWEIDGESLALRLRRCGFSYRQLVVVHLPDTLDAVADRMALVLHALATLPPAGTLPADALAQGLSELADAVQGDVVPHFIRDLSLEYPGLPSAIARLRRLAASEDTSLAGDIAWACQQYAAVMGAAASGPGLFARLFGAGSRSGVQQSGGSARWAEQAAQEWRALIAALEAQQADERRRPPARTGRGR